MTSRYEGAGSPGLSTDARPDLRSDARRGCRTPARCDADGVDDGDVRRLPAGRDDHTAELDAWRSRRQAVPLGWIGLALLSQALGQLLLRPAGLAGALWLASAVVAAALAAVAVRAHVDVRAGRRLGLEEQPQA